jgi:hypothetical protein
MSRKVFTAGEVLAAADVNSFLMDQTVMSFPTSAARGSAIPTPTLGMYTHLEDAPARTQFWDGSAWVSPLGSTLIETRSFTAQTGVTINNVFTSEFDNYVIEVEFIQNTAGAGINYWLVNGSTASASNWAGNQFVMFGSGSTQFAGYSGAANTDLSGINAGQRGSIKLSLFSPFLTRPTFGNSNSHFQASGAGANVAAWTASQLNNSTSYEGWRLTCSAGTFTGTVRIYGMRNS